MAKISLKKKLISACIMVVVLILSFSLVACNSVQTEGKQRERILTRISLSLQGKDGKITVTGRNEFDLFSSDVKVVLELYSSATYQESYADMQMAASNAVENLSKGQTITASASTRGKAMYWQGRIRYKINNDKWAVQTTGTAYYDADGAYVGVATFYQDSSLATLSTSQQTKIRNAYYEYYIKENPYNKFENADDVRLLTYYGEYNGCKALLFAVPKFGTGFTVETVADVTFCYYLVPSIVLYDGGENFYTMQQAWDKGILDASAVGKIGVRHKDKYKKVYDYLQQLKSENYSTTELVENYTLTAEEEEKVKQAYLVANSGSDPTVTTIADVNVARCLGSINGKLVLSINPTPSMADQYPDWSIIDNVPIDNFPRFKVYVDGKLYYIKDAYNQGIITKSELIAISQKDFGVTSDDYFDLYPNIIKCPNVIFLELDIDHVSWLWEWV